MLKRIALAVIVLAYVVVQSWFLWPEYGHRLVYKFTISPQKTLSKDVVLHRNQLYVGISRHGDINYLSNGAWINTIEGIYAPYISLDNPMAEVKPVFEHIIYNKVQPFKAGNDITAVSFSGYCEEHPYIHINTLYSISGSDTVLIRSSISAMKTTGQAAGFFWVGDKIKTNTHSILFYVPGIGDIITGERDAISPQKPYIAMLGRANQMIGFYYTDHEVPYLYYQWDWIATEFPVEAGPKPFELTRVISTKSTDAMDYRKIADSEYNSFLAFQSGVSITASSYNIITDQGKAVGYTVYVKNIDKVSKHITDVSLSVPDDVMISKPYLPDTPVSDTLYPGETAIFGFSVTPLQGGSFYLYPAVTVDGNYVEGQWTKLFSNGAGWYSADMHNHDTYSVSIGVYPVGDMAEAAMAKGLDVLGLTDYNSLSQSKRCRASSTAESMCIPAQEIANRCFAHANAMFIHKTVCEFTFPQHWINEVHRQGGMFFINHPYLGTIQRWRDFNVKGEDGIEVLNGFKIPMDPVNVRAFDKWDELNRKGLHLYGIADSDAHSAYAVGKYRDYVYAASFTLSAIEQGFRMGRFYVSNGPMLSFTIDGEPMGSTVTINPGQSIHIGLAYLPHAQCPEGAMDFQKLILFRDGYILKTFDNPSEAYVYTPDRSGFYRMEVFTNRGGFAASNPIWVNVVK